MSKTTKSKTNFTDLLDIQQSINNYSDSSDSEDSDNENDKPMYLACNDQLRPVCKRFVRNQCRQGIKCAFYHPKPITPILKAKGLRELGKCYCGYGQKTVINKKTFRFREDDFIFFKVCGRTGKSMNICRANLQDLQN